MPFQDKQSNVNHRWQGGRCIIRAFDVGKRVIEYEFEMDKDDPQTRYYSKLLKQEENEATYGNTIYKKKKKKHQKVK